jgi:uncharacterized protein (TIGR02646 family)
MRSIAKSTQPQTVTSLQCATTTNLTSNASARAAFNQLDKRVVRSTLAAEQGHLCAFCMRAINHAAMDANGQYTTPIAHRVPIDVDPSLALTWSNLLACCDGGRVARADVKTCDFAQGSAALTVDPTRATSVRQLRFERGDPTVPESPGASKESAEGLYLRSENESLRADVETLGLNRGDLPALRAQALKAFQHLLRRAHPPSTWTGATKPTFLTRWKAQHAPKLPPYVGVVEAWVAGQQMRCQ